MALLDFLKNKESAEKSRQNSPEREVKKAEKAEVVLATEDKKPHFAEVSRGKNKFSYDIIREPHISEKASILAEKNKYIFKVLTGSNKNEIKKSVEGTYNVKVLFVNIIKIPNKKRRVGKTKGFKKAYTKAVVTLKQGDKIEIL